MPIPTEPIGSIPRPPDLVAGAQRFATGRLSRDQFARLQDAAIRDTIRRFEATESPVITDGEQAKPSFHVPDPRAHEPRTRRRHDPVRGRARAATPPAD